MRIKKLISSIIMLILMCSIAACGSKKNELVGDMWYVSEKYIKADLDIFPTSVPNACISNYANCRVRFLSNGGIIVEAGNSDYKELTADLCTYSQTDGMLEIMAPLGSKSYSEFEIKNGTLTISDRNENKVVFTKEENFKEAEPESSVELSLVEETSKEPYTIEADDGIVLEGNEVIRVVIKNLEVVTEVYEKEPDSFLWMLPYIHGYFQNIDKGNEEWYELTLVEGSCKYDGNNFLTFDAICNLYPEVVVHIEYEIKSGGIGIVSDLYDWSLESRNSSQDIY